ncbi:MAG: universal stress protein [Euryarchaeota archaeon]|jgi:nucleotide-binding universal stress UspA family protein|nr:universal stress protein [Euryarchaeota archaeon]
MVYQKILVTSAGEYLDQMVKEVMELIADWNTEVIGLYVVETSTPILTSRKIKEMMKKELTEKGKKILLDMEEKFKGPNIKFKPLLKEGKPADEIVKIAEEEGVDLLIMGTGKSMVDKYLLGSVSEKVVHTSPCTVLLIRTSKE